MKKKLLELVSSKKFIVGTLGVAMVVANRVFALGLTEDDLVKVFGLTGITIGGIGLADLGKERAKLESGK